MKFLYSTFIIFILLVISLATSIPVSGQRTYSAKTVITNPWRFNKRYIRIRGKITMYHVKIRCKPGHGCDSRRYYISVNNHQINLTSWKDKQRPQHNSIATIGGFFRVEAYQGYKEYYASKTHSYRPPLASGLVALLLNSQTSPGIRGLRR